MKILIADDDLVNRRALEIFLEKAGYDVVAVSDGQAAWDHFQRPDAAQIALLDWMMPGFDGVELCRQLRARPHPEVLYILLLTARTGSNDAVLALQAGADDFVSKPFNRTELQARIEVGRRLVQSHNLLARNIQEMRLNLELARKVLSLANSGVPRWIGINEDLTLHLSSFSLSSKQAGGDHCWARTLPAQGARGPVTVIGLRDQSGHEVNCILRSIATDLLHREVLENGLGLECQIACLNSRLCSSGMFAEDEFVTGLTLELDHATLRLRYVSCGHPAMFLIRGNQISALPEKGGLGQNLPLGSLPNATFSAGECQLEPEDRLILYTDGLLELGSAPHIEPLSATDLSTMLTSVIRQSPDLPISEIIQQILSKSAGRPIESTSPRDDVTLLGLELEVDEGTQGTVLYPCSLGELDQAVTTIHRTLVQNWQVDETSMPSLRLTLEEALTNAWMHGNQQAANSPIRISWGRRNGYSITVEDAGAGFDPSSLPDPCAAEALLNEAGRGVYLIRRSCDWVDWKKKGTRLVGRMAHGNTHSETSQAFTRSLQSLTQGLLSPCICSGTPRSAFANEQTE
jgi:DNA-binding response OmpR family regulator/anti-sigma regulatory factor (Ser/Thr protein kinase)